ncbi:MAG: nitroreductase family protein [Candidatus Hodarchaeota archaeon]
MTNQVIEAIHNRQSIRDYEPKPVPRDIIKTIVEAGNQAPSRGREEKGKKEFLFQPWRFVVVENTEFKQKLVQTIFPIWKHGTESMKENHPELYEQVMKQYEEMEEPKDMIYHGAPVIIFVIGLASHPISCALACENIMIAATSLGLGSCYVGFGAMVKGNADVVQALELKDNERIYGPIVVGYPKGEDTLVFVRPKKKEAIIKWI